MSRAPSARAPGGEAVAFSRLHDASLHQDVLGPREFVRLSEPGLRGECADHAADSGEIAGARATEWVVGSHLEEHIDKRTGLEVVALEPVVEDIEDGEESPLRMIGSRSGSPFDDSKGPGHLSAGKKSEHQVIFGGKVAVQRCLRHTGGTDDLIHRDIPHRTVAEQSVARIDDALMRVDEAESTPRLSRGTQDRAGEHAGHDNSHPIRSAGSEPSCTLVFTPRYSLDRSTSSGARIIDKSVQSLFG